MGLAQIAGQFINSVGGGLVVRPAGGSWGGALQNSTTMFGVPGPTSTPPFGNANGQTWIDALDWQLHRIPIFDDVTGTYSYGGVNRDETAEDWSATANIAVDQRVAVDMLLKYGVNAMKGNAIQSQGNSQFGFNLGVELCFIEGCGTNYPSDLILDWFWCPSAKISQNGPIIDAGNKKDVRLSVSIVGNARIFKMPAECNIINDYLTHLQKRGQGF